ncbi:hypothetical protein FPV67DRAFT_1502775 [Lyophyllum atratum]|nr:hypothetical protein FPV67DRAFT_1502775 [Lyophyllum atratum]
MILSQRQFRTLRAIGTLHLLLAPVMFRTYWAKLMSMADVERRSGPVTHDTESYVNPVSFRHEYSFFPPRDKSNHTYANHESQASQSYSLY